MTEIIKLINTKSTEELGQRIAQAIKHLPVAIFLEGDLGAGKTTLTRSIIKSLLNNSDTKVPSPTYSYINHYRHEPLIHHFDLYRIEDSHELIDLGLIDFIYNDEAIRLIEWPKKLGELIFEPDITIHLKKNSHIRVAEIKSKSLLF